MVEFRPSIVDDQTVGAMPNERSGDIVISNFILGQ